MLGEYGPSIRGIALALAYAALVWTVLLIAIRRGTALYPAPRRKSRLPGTSQKIRSGVH